MKIEFGVDDGLPASTPECQKIVPFQTFSLKYCTFVSGR